MWYGACFSSLLWVLLFGAFSEAKQLSGAARGTSRSLAADHEGWHLGHSSILRWQGQQSTDRSLHHSLPISGAPGLALQSNYHNGVLVESKGVRDKISGASTTEPEPLLFRRSERGKQSRPASPSRLRQGVPSDQAQTGTQKRANAGGSSPREPSSPSSSQGHRSNVRQMAARIENQKSGTSAPSSSNPSAQRTSNIPKGSIAEKIAVFGTASKSPFGRSPSPIRGASSSQSSNGKPPTRARTPQGSSSSSTGLSGSPQSTIIQNNINTASHSGSSQAGPGTTVAKTRLEQAASSSSQKPLTRKPSSDAARVPSIIIGPDTPPREESQSPSLNTAPSGSVDPGHITAPNRLPVRPGASHETRPLPQTGVTNAGGASTGGQSAPSSNQPSSSRATVASSSRTTRKPKPSIPKDGHELPRTRMIVDPLGVVKDPLRRDSPQPSAGQSNSRPPSPPPRQNSAINPASSVNDANTIVPNGLPGIRTANPPTAQASSLIGTPLSAGSGSSLPSTPGSRSNSGSDSAPSTSNSRGSGSIGRPLQRALGTGVTWAQEHPKATMLGCTAVMGACMGGIAGPAMLAYGAGVTKGFGLGMIATGSVATVGSVVGGGIIGVNDWQKNERRLTAQEQYRAYQRARPARLVPSIVGSVSSSLNALGSRPLFPRPPSIDGDSAAATERTDPNRVASAPARMSQDRQDIELQEIRRPRQN